MKPYYRVDPNHISAKPDEASGSRGVGAREQASEGSAKVAFLELYLREAKYLFS